MVKQRGDDQTFPGGRAAERLKQFERQHGLRPDLPGADPPAKPERDESDEG